MLETPLLLAFSAGVISFLAPCILPIIPAYLTFISGVSFAEVSLKRWQIFRNSIFFVLGFTLVFASLGVLLNTLFEKVAFDVQVWLSRIGGLLIIFFGVYLTGIFHLGFLEREHKLQINKAIGPRYFSSFIFGAAFAAGWTPCVGAVLGGILGLAASQPGIAFWLLVSYSLGFGLPFMLVGLFTSQASQLISKAGPYTRFLNIIFGIILVVIGILIFTQTLSRFANLELLQRLAF